jgi:hypothetical protein
MQAGVPVLAVKELGLHSELRPASSRHKARPIKREACRNPKKHWQKLSIHPKTSNIETREKRACSRLGADACPLHGCSVRLRSVASEQQGCFCGANTDGSNQRCLKTPSPKAQ